MGAGDLMHFAVLNLEALQAHRQSDLRHGDFRMARGMRKAIDKWSHVVVALEALNAPCRVQREFAP